MENDKNRILAAMLLLALVALAAEGFQTPTGNIRCAILGEGLGCGSARGFCVDSEQRVALNIGKKIGRLSVIWENYS